ncbi:inorganic diphosphatase [Haloflavibacter putidus]|uniref:inorganic diphosphatase n=1 Tax=Haloflavibacter putidus TaxID=2576776 RepID=A0A507ZD92_9FLAO|nr:inorganic diphosphatase [Haloflavibacter putidus]TQD34877.1 inorganic diphosphatase [Haloflavibacter putidus]
MRKRKITMLKILGVLSLFFLVGCKNSEKQNIDYKTLPAYNAKKNLQAVIEIPAGSNQKIEYKKDTNRFVVDSINKQARVIDFLPYPGNYGFIPGTYSNPKNNGDGDALDVLVLSESLASGTLIEIKPIAMMRLLDEGEKDFKIIAVPLNKNLRTMQLDSFENLSLKYPHVRKILHSWFENYDKTDKLEIKGWTDGKTAEKLIQQALVN